MKRSAPVPVPTDLGEGRIRASPQEQEVSGSTDSVSTCRLSQEDSAGSACSCWLNSPQCCALTLCLSFHTPLPGLVQLKNTYKDALETCKECHLSLQ